MRVANRHLCPPSGDGTFSDVAVSLNRLIVIGASAGGVEAVKEVLRVLPSDLPAAVAVVVHMAPATPSVLAHIWGRATALRVTAAEQGERLEHGVVYVPLPDHHLLVNEGIVEVTRGPRENRQRPAIDPLFRSAALAYGPRVIGVILTGFLDDGSAGLVAVERAGGVTMVQDPSDAMYPAMPQNALAQVDADHCAPLNELARRLIDLVQRPIPERLSPNDTANALEVEATRKIRSRPEVNDAIGTQVPYNCPECGGPLWEIHRESTPRFRCHIGHAYSAHTLIADQTDTIERSLWAAYRVLEERARMLARMAERARGNGQANSASSFADRSEESRQHADVIRQLLEKAP